MKKTHRVVSTFTSFTRFKVNEIHNTHRPARYLRNSQIFVEPGQIFMENDMFVV